MIPWTPTNINCKLLCPNLFGVVDISGRWLALFTISLVSPSSSECSSEWDGSSVVQVLKEVPAGSFGCWWDVCLTPRYRSSRRYRRPYHASSSSPSVLFPFGDSCPRVLRWIRQCPLVDHCPILYDQYVRNCRCRREVVVLGLQRTSDNEGLKFWLVNVGINQDCQKHRTHTRSVSRGGGYRGKR